MGWEFWRWGGGVFSGGLVLVGGATLLGKWKTPGQKKRVEEWEGKRIFGLQLRQTGNKRWKRTRNRKCGGLFLGKGKKDTVWIQQAWRMYSRQRTGALNFVSRKFLCKHFCEIKKYILYFNEQNGCLPSCCHVLMPAAPRNARLPLPGIANGIIKMMTWK